MPEFTKTWNALWLTTSSPPHTTPTSWRTSCEDRAAWRHTSSEDCSEHTCNTVQTHYVFQFKTFTCVCLGPWREAAAVWRWTAGTAVMGNPSFIMVTRWLPRFFLEMSFQRWRNTPSRCAALSDYTENIFHPSHGAACSIQPCEFLNVLPESIFQFQTVNSFPSNRINSPDSSYCGLWVNQDKGN